MKLKIKKLYFFNKRIHYLNILYGDWGLGIGYSLRYNTSEKIAGIPNDEIALDPVLTQKYKKSNNTKIIPTFTYESLDHSD